MSQELKPKPNRIARIVGVALLSALGALGSTPWMAKIGFMISMVLILGTFRRFQVTEKSLRHRWTVAFIDLPSKSWKHKRFTKIETRYSPATGILEFLIFGPLGFLFGWILDTFFSWVGGTYEIWLNDEVDNGVLAWQGNSQQLFEENVELLKTMVDVPVVARS